MWRQFLLSILLVSATPLAAQEGGHFLFGGDAYLAGRTVTLDDAVPGDLFAAGNRIMVDRAVEGAAHLAGRSVSVDGDVAGNLYAMGMTIASDGAVGGNATLMGQSVTVLEAVGGNLRAMGADVTISAPVAGSAILGGDLVSLDGEISGDLAFSAAEIQWGEAARVSGQVHVYAEDDATVEVPARVAPADRVTLHPIEAWHRDMPMDMDAAYERPGFWARLGSLFGKVLVTGLLATGLAVLAPGFTASLRERALERPGRSLWIGALGLSATIGATVVLAMTGIGIFVAPLAIFAAIALGLAGYVIGAYLLGVWAVKVTGQGLPARAADRAIAAFVGAGLLTFLALVPFIGWFAVVMVLLAGVGALVIRLFDPAFFAEA